MTMLAMRDGHRLFVTAQGSGPAMLLIHGFTGSHDAWGEPLLRSLSTRFRVICVDLIGHGASDAPEDPQRYALESMVDDMCTVLDAFRVQRAIWIGYSMGGRIALGAAVLRAQRVGRLILESASPGMAHPEQRRERRAADERLARRLETENLEPFMDGWIEQPLFRTQQRLAAEIRIRERERRLRNRPAALASCLRGLGTGRQPSFWPALSAIDRPVRLIVGADDLKFCGIANRMVAVLPRADLAIMGGCGHTCHLEVPSAWIRTVIDFCQRTTSDRGEEKDEGAMGIGS